MTDSGHRKVQTQPGRKWFAARDDSPVRTAGRRCPGLGDSIDSPQQLGLGHHGHQSYGRGAVRKGPTPTPGDGWVCLPGGFVASFSALAPALSSPAQHHSGALDPVQGVLQGVQVGATFEVEERVVAFPDDHHLPGQPPPQLLQPLDAQADLLRTPGCSLLGRDESTLSGAGVKKDAVDRSRARMPGRPEAGRCSTAGVNGVRIVQQAARPGSRDQGKKVVAEGVARG